MPSDDHDVRACTRQKTHDIDHWDAANGRARREPVTSYFDASGRKLCRNVFSGSLKGGRRRWTWTQRDEPLQVLEGSRPVEALRFSSEVGPGSVVGYHERNH
jgi:hypothetical protein